MSVFRIEERPATNIGFNSATLNCELVALDELYDAAIVEFEYADNPDYNNSIKTATRGIFELNGTASIDIDGLTEDTTYYAKKNAKSVAYASAESMDNAVEQEGFMGDLASNEVEFDKIVNSEMNMDKVTDSVIAMDSITDSEPAMDKMLEQLTKGMPGIKFFTSQWLIDTMWSKQIASEKFWDKGIENLDWKMDIDFTNVNTLKVYIKSLIGGREAIIYIDGAKIYDDDDFDWKEVSLDVSGYSGVKTLELSYYESEKDNLRIDNNIPANYTDGKSITFYVDGEDGVFNVYYYGLRLEE